MVDMGRRVARFGFAAALLTTYLATRLPAQDPWPILDRADAAYQTVRTLTADFVQVITNPLVGEPDTTRGRFYQMRPSFFEMRFTAPQGDRIVADGRHLWLYTPSTTPGQVIRTPIPTVGSTGPNLMGQFVERARERYAARYVRADPLPSGMTDVIALTPTDPTLPYRGAIVWIAREDGMVRKLEIAELSGQQRTLLLRGLQVNADVPAREFKFTVPRGVQVVDQ